MPGTHRHLAIGHWLWKDYVCEEPRPHAPGISSFVYGHGEAKSHWELAPTRLRGTSGFGAEFGKL